MSTVIQIEAIRGCGTITAKIAGPHGTWPVAAIAIVTSRCRPGRLSVYSVMGVPRGTLVAEDVSRKTARLHLLDIAERVIAAGEIKRRVAAARQAPAGGRTAPAPRSA